MFGVIRSKKFLVIDKHKLEIKLNVIPDILYYKNNEKAYRINKVIGQPINKTLVYYWIHIEKIK